MRRESDNNPCVNCVVCNEDKNFVSIGSCNHHKVCLYCTMKMRILYNDQKCPICNTKLDHVFIVNFQNLSTFEELEKSKHLYFADEDEESGILYCEIEAKEEALELRGYNCPIKSCRSDPFENMSSLNQHLAKVHKRFYCQCCLKEREKFLSEMEIYNETNLKEHMDFGEYFQGSLVCPPHPECPFCKQRFYNDDSLFRHMNQEYFSCQLCKDRKNIIFYKALDGLKAHHRSRHYCCPFQECLDDIYVVFEKETELVAHLKAKHHFTNCDERITEICLNQKREEKVNKDAKAEEGFNFNDYTKELKEKSEKHKQSLLSRKKYINTQESEHIIGEDGTEYYINYQDTRGDGRRGRGKNWKKNKRDFNNKYSNDNYNNYNYNNDKSNKYNHYNKNKYNNNYNNNYGNNYNNNYSNNYNNNNYNNNYKNNQSGYQEWKKSNDNNQKDWRENKKDSPQQKKNFDYSFVLNFYLKAVKKYLREKINVDKVPKEQFVLEREIIHQMRAVIDKFDSYQKLVELTSLHNFGIDMNVNKELKELMSNGDCDEKNFYDILSALSIKKILIIYKYLWIAAKKVDNLFYKLDLDQIECNLYDDFVEKKKEKSESNPLRIAMNSQFETYNEAESSKGKKSKPSPWGSSSTNTNTNKKVEKENKPKSQLAKLFDEEVTEKKDTGTKKKITQFKLSNYNYDEEFPSFK